MAGREGGYFFFLVTPATLSFYFIHRCWKIWINVYPRVLLEAQPLSRGAEPAWPSTDPVCLPVPVTEEHSSESGQRREGQQTWTHRGQRRINLDT